MTTLDKLLAEKQALLERLQRCFQVLQQALNLIALRWTDILLLQSFDNAGPGTGES